MNPLLPSIRLTVNNYMQKVGKDHGKSITSFIMDYEEFDSLYDKDKFVSIINSPYETWDLTSSFIVKHKMFIDDQYFITMFLVQMHMYRTFKYNGVSGHNFLKKVQRSNILNITPDHVILEELYCTSFNTTLR